MFKTRGKPEDPWNLAAVEQNKGLAAAVHINQIRQNGIVPYLNKEIPNRIQRQELIRRRQNYQEFREKYHEKIKLTNTVQEPCKHMRRPERVYYKHDVQVIKRFVDPRVNDRRNNNGTKERYQPAMLRAPLRTVKTVSVEVPGGYKEEAIFTPPKFGEGESFPFYEKLKEFEKLKEKVNQVVTAEEDTQTDLVKELEEVSLEVDIGNAQLEEINKILQAKRSQKYVMEEELSRHRNDQQDLKNANLYNVQPKTPARKLTASEKEARISKKTKLLLTLNDVHERIQRLQTKFFNNTRPPYKSVNNVLNSDKQHASVQILYKNINYTSSNIAPKVSTAPAEQSLRLDLSAVEHPNLNSPRPHSNEESIREPEKFKKNTTNKYGSKMEQEILKSVRPHTAEAYKRSDGHTQQRVTNRNLLNKQINRNRRDELKLQKDAKRTGIINKLQISEIPNVNLMGDHAQAEDFWKQHSDVDNNSAAQYNNYNTFKHNGVMENDLFENLHTSKKVVEEGSNKGSDMDMLFQTELQESILKSDYLMKEFDINLKDMPFDMSKLPPISENKRSSKKNVQPNITPLQKLQNERTPWDYKRENNNHLYTPLHSLLKNTLYCVEEI